VQKQSVDPGESSSVRTSVAVPAAMETVVIVAGERSSADRRREAVSREGVAQGRHGTP
jgi:hypothetical protein